MTIDEIKASGLLELFALGQLSAREHEVVEQHIALFPALRNDLRAIERALENYAQAAAVQVPAALKQRILDGIKANQPGQVVAPSRQIGSGWRVAAALAALVAVGLMYLLSQKNNELKLTQQRLTAVLDSCQQQNQANLAQIEEYQQIFARGNEIVHMVGTPGYPQTDLYLHHNPVTNRNFIQVVNLPALAANQSFQLWSLKPNTAPIPLDVFQTPTDLFFEVRHEDATQNYAITIEPLGGQNAPTLANLIGIVGVSAGG